MATLASTFAVIYFILGAIIGSFLNVLILRYNTNKSNGGRSACMSCGRQLAAIDLVPILSWIMLRGRCRSCTSRISWQYPLVELTLAVLFVLVSLKGLVALETAAALLLSMLFLFVVVYDLKHLIIPVWPMRLITVLAFASLFVDLRTLTWVTPSLWDALMGPALFSFFALLFVATRGRGVGFGDAKLSLAIGWLLGFPEALYAFMLAFWIGAVVGLALLLYSKRAERRKQQYLIEAETTSIAVTSSDVGKGVTIAHLRRVYLAHTATPLWHGKSEVPFAPFLALGTGLVYFFHSHILSIANYFNVVLY